MDRSMHALYEEASSRKGCISQLVVSAPATSSTTALSRC